MVDYKNGRCQQSITDVGPLLGGVVVERQPPLCPTNSPSFSGRKPCMVFDNAGDGSFLVVFLLGSVVLESRYPFLACVVMLAGPIDGCAEVEAAASRWFLHVGEAASDCCAVVTQCGGVMARQSVSDGFVLQGWRGCRLGRCVPARGDLQYVEAVASDVVWRSWSAGSCPGQFGLRLTRSCDAAARARAVACRGGGPGRRSRWIAQGMMESWMSGRRLRVFRIIEGVSPCVMCPTRFLSVLFIVEPPWRWPVSSTTECLVSAPRIVDADSYLR